MPEINASGAVVAAPTAPQMPSMPPLTPPTAVAPPVAAAPPAANDQVAQLQAQLAAAQAAAAQVQAAPAPQVPVTPQFPTPQVQSPPTVSAPLPQMPPITAPPVAPAIAAPPVAAPAPVAVQPPPIGPAVLPPTGFQPVPVSAAPPPVPGAQVMPDYSGISQQMEAMQSGSGALGAFLQHDLSGVQTNNFKLLPLDVSFYEGWIRKCEFKQGSTGYPQIKLTLCTCYPTIHAGVTLNDYITVKPETMWKYKGFLEATGCITPDGRPNFTGPQDFIGKAVQFQIRHDPFEGQLRNKVAGGYSESQYADEMNGAAETISLPAPAFQTASSAGTAVPAVAWAPAPATG